MTMEMRDRGKVGSNMLKPAGPVSKHETGSSTPRSRNHYRHKSDEQTTEQEETETESESVRRIYPSNVRDVFHQRQTDDALSMSSKEKWARFRTRLMPTVVLGTSFIAILTAGHFYCSLLVIALTIGVYQEVIALKQNDEKDRRLPAFFLLRWYWFAVTIFAVGHMFLFPLLLALVGESKRSMIEFIVSHHAMFSYILGLTGFILFITSLRRFSLNYQFGHFALLLLTCIFVVGQSMVQISIIYSGLIWFFLSSSCVIVNDIFAYIFGTFFGRTKLLKLSPKKTLEGYLGAAFVTIIWAFLVSTYLSIYPVFHCQKDVVTFMPYSMWWENACMVPDGFSAKQYELPHLLAALTGHESFTALPVQLHGLSIGLFAAFFAPFGGFFASGFKRALRIKDFGSSIPGHGGLLDRFDCQIFMGMFTYLYIRTFVFRQFGVPNIATLMRHVKRLAPEDQYRLYMEIRNLLSKSVNETSYKLL